MPFHTKKDVNFRISSFSLGLIFFSVLACLSIFYFKERMLCYDPAFFSFQILQAKDYVWVLGRWGSVFSEILPVYALKHGCDLETFLRLYSVSFILLYFINFLVVTLILKNQKAGIALVLTLCLAFRHSFYYSTAELYQGLSLCITFWALIAPENPEILERKTGFKIMRYILAGLLVYVISFFHQLTLFPLIFITGFEMIRRKRYADKGLILLLILTVLWYYLRISIFTLSDYEKNKIPGIRDFFTVIPHLHKLPSTLYFLSYSYHHLKTLILFSIAGVVLAFRHKNHILNLFFIAFMLGFIYLNIVTYRNGESPLMYANYYTVLGFFAAVFVVNEFYDRYKKILLLIAYPVTAVCLWGIAGAHQDFSDKVHYQERLAKNGMENGNRKMVLAQENFPWQYAWIKWSLPFETLLTSALQGPEHAVTAIAFENVHERDSLFAKPDVFLGPEWALNWFSLSSLNKEFYHLPETPYQIANNSQDSLNDSLFTRDSLALELNRKTFYIHNKKACIPVVLRNKSLTPLPSLRGANNKVSVSYHLYDTDNHLVAWDNIRTPLEVDLHHTLEQGVNIELPERKSYRIVIDLVSEGKKWWGLEQSCDLIWH